MGRNKAAIKIEGETLLGRVVGALRLAGAGSITVVGGGEIAARAVGAHWTADAWPGEGPLGGVVTGLRGCSRELALVAACDLPDVATEDVAFLVAALAAEPVADAVVPLVDGRLQPLLAAYRRRCAPTLALAFERGERRLVGGALDDLTVASPPRTGSSFRDLDTPIDVARRRSDYPASP